MRLILPGLVVLLLTACGLKDDLYLPDEVDPQSASTQDNSTNRLTGEVSEEDDDGSNP